MIAIAGAKGGCGKTTTTLGLTEAFARAGTPTLAVDADRQLPNLHVVAGVEREPTLTALDAEADMSSIAQPIPDTTRAGVIAAPNSTDSVELGTALESLPLEESVRVLIDCPSGTGPDVVEPLSVADAVLVATTETGRSVSAAETTIDIACRLEVPVVGVVFTQCDTVSTDLESRFDVPVLGVVPDHDSPLTASVTRQAYDELVSRLQERERGRARARAQTRSGSDRSREIVRVRNRASETVQTGNDAIDRALDGGLPPGCLVAYTAPPASQSALLLHELTATRGTLYVTTDRPADDVRDELEGSPTRVGNPTVRHLEGDPDDVLEEAERLVAALPAGANLIVDTMDALERSDRPAYVEFLNSVKAHLAETGSIGVVRCLKGPSQPEHRPVTVHVADVVFDLRTNIDGNGLETVLSIPKRRGKMPPAETIALEFAESMPSEPSETSPDVA